MENLLALQQLEFGARKTGKVSERERLRSAIPEIILGNIDRLLARGKRGVSVIRQGVCTECHLRLPLGTLLTLARGEDLQLCGNCGRYLYLPEEETPGHLAPKNVEAKVERPKRGRAGSRRHRASELAAA
jgi:predicted  nucleic acid-binding Zn-ribbon protein